MNTKRSSKTAGLRRASVVFDGRVQGVGFRLTTCEVASRFRVTGYVRNAEDGSVELVAEGVEQEVARFLDALRASHVTRFVRNERLEWSTAHGEFDRFSVHYG